MAYRIEGNDIVIDGFEKGVAESPYDGIADIRNAEIVNILGEASVQYAMAAAQKPPVFNDVPYTTDQTTDRITIADATGLYEGCAIRVTPSGEVDFESLLIGGGGGGGGGIVADPRSGGGGGGGGFLSTNHTDIPNATYVVTIGAGGAGGVAAARGANGGNTSIGALATALGGGGGGADDNNDGADGGCGGGSTDGGNPGTGSQGFNGGDSTNGAFLGAGGGGGAGQVGQDGSPSAFEGGDGGDGLASTITGSSVTYAGGGGAVGADGGTGGGGDGADGSNFDGDPGTNGLGGGGGGGAANAENNRNGGAGGSGVGFISYPTTSFTGTSTQAVAADGAFSGSEEAGTLAAAWRGPTGTFPVVFSNGDERDVDFTNNNTAISWTGGLSSAASATMQVSIVTTSGGNTIHHFYYTGSFTISELEEDHVYYVRNIVGNTFQISDAPGGSIIDIGSDSEGVLTTYQYGNQLGNGGSVGTPRAYMVDRRAYNGVCNGIYLVDSSNYGWGIYPVQAGGVPANSLVFLGNIGGGTLLNPTSQGLFLWKEYCFIMGGSTIDNIDLGEWWTTGPSVWNYFWESVSVRSTNNKISSVVAQDDGVYFTSFVGVGSLLEVAGQSFDPDDSNTYTINDEALTLPSIDGATCLAELGTYLLVGGYLQWVYPWDRVSTSYNYPIYVPDKFTVNIVGTNQNAYIFSGNRGRIYITNGSSIDLYYKIPDYITGGINPYIRWWDASYDRNQLYFTFSASTNADADLASVNGAWAIDLQNKSFRMVNKITNSGYSGICKMCVEMPPNGQAENPDGTSLCLGWNVSTTYGVDVGSPNPYSNYETFVDTDMIPVGTFLSPFTPSQLEWKVSAPLVANEAVSIFYRTNITDSFVAVGESTEVGSLSGLFKSNFQKAQWVQFRVYTKSTATTPSFTRLTEMRIRDWPSQ